LHGGAKRFRPPRIWYNVAGMPLKVSLISRSTLPGIVWPMIPATGDRRRIILTLLQQFQENERRPEAEIRARQFQQLGRLLAHARSSVPHYRLRFASVTIADPTRPTVEEWAALPRLSRQDIQQAGRAMYSTAVPRGHGRVAPIFTSGTTGRPVRVLRTAVNGLFWSAFTLRDHLWHRRNLKGKLAAMRHAGKGVDPYPQGSRSRTWGPTGLVYETGPAVALNINCTAAEQADWLQRENPDYLLTHPTVAYGLATYCRDNGIRPGNLKQVMTLSEVVRPDVRDACRAAWGVGVADIYTGRDVGYIALQCPEHECYHVQSEGMYVEILDATGRPTAPGEIGQVVVTPLHNFAMPLIRYEIGDQAEVGEPCPCGRNLPVIKRILGRHQDMATLPTGEKRWTLLSTGNIESFLEIAPIRQYQFVQKDLRTFEVRLVIDRDLSDGEKEKIRDWVREKVGYPFDVTFTFVDEIPRTTSGKYRDFISEVADSGLAPQQER
jgi:phenylacetate-CoA ligase